MLIQRSASLKKMRAPDSNLQGLLQKASKEDLSF
jgi:hypothetical protein